MAQQQTVFLSVETRDDLIMSDHQPPASPDASAADGEPTESPDGRDHDCQQHLEYVDYEWVDSCYDDRYVCGVCEKEFRMVYLNTRYRFSEGVVERNSE